MSNPRRQLFIPAGFAGVVIWFAAAVHPAVADESATPWTLPAARGGEAGDCAVASRRFDLHSQLPAAAPEQAHALGRARVVPLLATPCGRAIVARDV